MDITKNYQKFPVPEIPSSNDPSKSLNLIKLFISFFISGFIIRNYLFKLKLTKNNEKILLDASHLYQKLNFFGPKDNISSAPVKDIYGQESKFQIEQIKQKLRKKDSKLGERSVGYCKALKLYSRRKRLERIHLALMEKYGPDFAKESTHPSVNFLLKSEENPESLRSKIDLPTLPDNNNGREIEYGFPDEYFYELKKLIRVSNDARDAVLDPIKVKLAIRFNLTMADISENQAEILSQERGKKEGETFADKFGHVLEHVSDDFVHSQEKVQNERLKTLNDYCSGSEKNISKTKLNAKTKFLSNNFDTKLTKIFFNPVFKFSMCLIQKTGVTNWQISMMENLIKNHGVDMKFNLNLLKPPRIFGMGDRIYQILVNPMRFESILTEQMGNSNKKRKTGLNRVASVLFDDTKEWIHGINVRHPFARLYSAFRQKFDVRYYVRNYQVNKMHGDIMMKIDENNNFVNPNYPDTIASFKSFLILITKFKDLKLLNSHWAPMYLSCNACDYNINFISHTESSETDSKYFFGQIFQKNENDNNTAYGFPPAYGNGNQTKFYKHHFIEAFGEDWRENKVIKQLYKIYEKDFLMYGFSLDQNF